MASSELQTAISTINELSSEEKTDSTLEELTKAFRHLRNMCAEGRHIQTEIFSDECILTSTHIILGNLLSQDEKTETSDSCLAVGLQFLGNLLVGNSDIQKTIWEVYENLLKWCLKLGNSKVQNCSAMIMYNIFLGHPEYISLEKDLIENIIALTKNEKSSDFALYLFQLFIQKTQFIQGMYTILKPDSKIAVIETLHELFRNSEEMINMNLTQYLVRKFMTYSDTALKLLNTSPCSPVAYEMVKILDYMTSISDNEHYQKMIQSEEGLLEKSVNLLKTIHSVSKEPGNYLSMIQKMSDLQRIEKNHDIQSHPYFGFKCATVRLIGNLCWNNADCQNTIRRMDLIPVILDCCCIDGRNPFITQWSILAIRNVCHNNADNQKYIADLPKLGIIDAEKLKSYGIMFNENITTTGGPRSTRSSRCSRSPRVTRTKRTSGSPRARRNSRSPRAQGRRRK